MLHIFCCIVENKPPLSLSHSLSLELIIYFTHCCINDLLVQCPSHVKVASCDCI